MSTTEWLVWLAATLAGTAVGLRLSRARLPSWPRATPQSTKFFQRGL